MGRKRMTARVEGLGKARVGDEVKVQVGVAPVPGRVLFIDNVGGLRYVRVAWGGREDKFDVAADGVGHTMVGR